MGGIAIKLDSPYKPKIEEFNEFENSLFQESYKIACDSVRDIIARQPNTNNNCTEENNLPLYINSNMIYNIVPFIGDRGSGKTSVMLSFRKYLNDYQRGRLKESNTDFDLGTPILSRLNR